MFGKKLSSIQTQSLGWCGAFKYAILWLRRLRRRRQRRIFQPFSIARPWCFMNGGSDSAANRRRIVSRSCTLCTLVACRRMLSVCLQGSRQVHMPAGAPHPPPPTHTPLLSERKGHSWRSIVLSFDEPQSHSSRSIILSFDGYPNRTSSARAIAHASRRSFLFLHRGYHHRARCALDSGVHGRPLASRPRAPAPCLPKSRTHTTTPSP